MRFRRPHGAHLPEDWRDLARRHVRAWQRLTDDEREVLAHHVQDLVTTRRWEPAKGFDLTDRVRVVVAAQAGLLALGLDEDCYRDVGSIIVHPSTMRMERRSAGPVEGTESCGSVDLLGEAVFGGPVVIAWDSASAAARHPERGFDVVVHEFAHKIDMLDGVVDGTPPLVPGPFVERWVEVNTATYEHLVEHGDRLIDDYAATDAGEFFAVVSEHFITVPDRLHAAHPELYGLYTELYGQDPLDRLHRVPRHD